MIVMAMGVVISFIQIFTIGTSGIAGAIIGAIFSAYFFICIYSLYEKIKAETNSRQQQPHMANYAA